MPVIRTFVSHHGGDFESRVEPILRHAAPLGVRPWLDKYDLGDRVGLPLADQLREAIHGGQCSSLTLFLSKAAVTRKWIEMEVQWALEHLDPTFRILPILLDPIDQIDLPETFRTLLRDREVIWLEPEKTPRFLMNFATSVLAAGGLNKESKEVTLYMGHRIADRLAAVPAVFSQAPTIDLRLAGDGNKDFCPTEAEWPQIEHGLEVLKEYLGQLECINVCGHAPLGVAHLIGKTWDRGAARGDTLLLRSFNIQSQQVWSTDWSDYGKCSDWTPDHAKHLQMGEPEIVDQPSLLVVLLLQGQDEYLRHVRAWNQKREQPSPLLIVKLPKPNGSAELAQEVMIECVGMFRYLRRNFACADLIELISGYPLALAPLISYHLRTLGPIHFYDEVKQTHSYRLATLIK